MLSRLHAMKGEPTNKQVRMVKRFVDALPDEFAASIKRLVETGPNRIIQVIVSDVDSERISIVALLSVIYSDIGTVPDRRVRDDYSRQFTLLCGKLDVNEEDVAYLVNVADEIEELIQEFVDDI